MLPPIIGLFGRSRSGKDTVANLLRERYPEYSIQRLSAPIKESARALFLFNDAQLEGSQKETVDSRWGVTPRRVFQTITEDTMKYMGGDFFTKLFYHKYDAGGFGGSHVIIPDIRYIHDIEEIHRRGGVVLKIIRSALPVRYACENHIDDLMTHLPVIHNNGTLEDLKNALQVWMSGIETVPQSNRML